MIDPIAPDAGVFSASPGQERLWFLAQMSDAASSAYSLAVRVELHGVLDQVALQASVNAVLARHEALRTGLRQSAGGLVQVVLPGVTSIVRPVQAELSDVPRLLRQEVRRGWNLGQPPLVRCLLLRIAPDHHILLLCVHHIVCDGLSLQIVLDELIEHYQRAGAGDPAKAAPPTQFADYVAWNSADHSAAPDPERAHRRMKLAEYWSETLRGAPDMLELPTDHRPPLVQSFAGARVPVWLGADLAHRLRGWAARARVTPFTVLLSAFIVVLARNSGSDDLVVGLPIANREHPDLARTVGYLANTCPLRADLRADPQLRQVVGQVHAALTGLLDHSGLPFGDLVKILAPARRLDKNPVFQVMFGLQQNVRRSHQLPGLRARADDVDTGSARVDLSLFLFEDSSGEVTGFLEYTSALFTQPTAERLTGQLLTVLRQLMADVELPVSAVPLADAGVEEPSLTPGAGESLAESWNVAWPQVIARASRQPTAVAVRDDHRELSYQQLTERIEAAGALLQRHRVRPGDRVAVHTERGVGAVVAMLACWGAGASYVPIDPAAPASRRKLILENADPLVIVCDDRGALPAEFHHRAIAQHALLDAPITGMSFVPIRPDGVAYLMFTSGSTGRPKGVSVSHRNLASLLRAMRPYCQFTPNDRLLALTTTSFDISLLELLGPLVDGAAVVVAPSCTQHDGTELADRLSDPEITIAQATPAIWRLALTAGWHPPPDFRVLCGGEAMPPDLADSLASGATVVHNLYGPTETTIWSCSSRVVAGEPVTIGRPIPGTHVLVVDTNLNEVPVGVCGELLIGGPGVAVGYLGHAALTAARFLPDPRIPGQRVYRTGDLVRWRTEGTLEFVGRADEQVKIRGHRIELREIESVLRNIEGVLDAAATVLGRADTARLVGYLVTAQGGADDPSWPATVRKAAAELLPASMVPAELYIVRSIPLSANGKVDRGALAGTGRKLEVTIDRVAPRTDAERRVAALWCELLDTSEIGATDNFFALGGHSLLAAALLQRVESELGVRVPVAEFFVEPTVAHIAGSLPEPCAQFGDTAEQPTAADDGQEPDNWDFETVHLLPGERTAAEVLSDVSEEAWS